MSSIGERLLKRGVTGYKVMDKVFKIRGVDGTLNHLEQQLPFIQFSCIPCKQIGYRCRRMWDNLVVKASQLTLSAKDRPMK